MPAAHGTVIRARTGCPCVACQAAGTRTYRNTPRGVKPPIVRKFGKAQVVMDTDCDLDALFLVSIEGLGGRVSVEGRCNPETWDDLMDSDANIRRAQDAVDEVIETVPSTKKVDVDPSRYRKGGSGRDSTTIAPGEDPRAPIELPVLIAQMRVISTGLITGETDIGVAIKQYGRLRDEIARRRREFAEAEGVFEVLQRAITAKVSE